MADLDTDSCCDNDAYFRHAAGCQLVVDPVSDRILSANAEFCALLGCADAELVDTRCSEVFKANFKSLLVFTQEIVSHGRGISDELVLLTPDGECRMEAIGRASQVNGEALMFLTLQSVRAVDSFRDQRDANRYFKSGFKHWSRVSRIFQEFEWEHQMLLDAAGEGIYGIDTEGMTTFVNPAAQAILGYNAEELARKNMHTTVHHSHADGAHFCKNDCPIIATCREGVVKTVLDDVFWTKSQEPVEVEYTSTPVIEDGEIVGAVVVFRDVTEKRSNERRLLDALNEVESLKNRLELEKEYLQEEISSGFNHHQIIGQSPALLRSIEQIDLVGPTEATVLIMGESGTGKELIARAIHQTSSRSERPLIRVNCAAIPENLFESEFFGHVKGSFSGATRDRVGRFELADGGTLFLDEVGEIPLHLQSKLLRVLQERQFERIGDNFTRTVNVRIVAATNRDLRELVDSGDFREDLYFRLNVFPIVSAPLRQRREDIPFLAQHFLEKACARANKPVLQISMKGMESLQSYDWPGNIRELENVVERQVILNKRSVMSFETLSATSVDKPAQLDADEGFIVLTESQMKAQERRNVINALKKTGGKVSGKDGAAILLDMKPTTLASKIKKFRIDVSNV